MELRFFGFLRIRMDQSRKSELSSRLITHPHERTVHYLLSATLRRCSGTTGHYRHRDVGRSTLDRSAKKTCLYASDAVHWRKLHGVGNILCEIKRLGVTRRGKHNPWKRRFCQNFKTSQTRPPGLGWHGSEKPLAIPKKRGENENQHCAPPCKQQLAHILVLTRPLVAGS